MKFRTSDGYTLYRQGETWVDSLDPETLDMTFESGPEGLPVDNIGEVLDGDVVEEAPLPSPRTRCCKGFDTYHGTQHTCRVCGKANPEMVDCYTVALIHDGTDWGVLPATLDDDPDTLHTSHAEACAAAQRLAAEWQCEWFDLTLVGGDQ